MPGKAQYADMDDASLNTSFRTDKIEFLVVSRPLSPAEDAAQQQITDVNEADWDIPKEAEYDDVMGEAINKFTETDSDLIHVICWSSVNRTTDTGVFSIKTGNLRHIERFRGILRCMFLEGKCYETFPRLAILKKFQLSAYCPKNTIKISTNKIMDWIMSCNEGLQGEIRPFDVKFFSKKACTPWSPGDNLCKLSSIS